MGEYTAAALMLSIPAYFVLQIFLGRRWSGVWRVAALLPLIVMGPVLIHAILAYLAQSNLWPILLILSSPFALAYLVALIALRTGVQWVQG
jgi:hypothetical protein